MVKSTNGYKLCKNYFGEKYWNCKNILPFPKKGDLGLAKNYRGITHTSIAAKIYNAA